jgi:uncharacterized repeat protein (TIGR03917 family)
MSRRLEVKLPPGSTIDAIRDQLMDMPGGMVLVDVRDFYTLVFEDDK